MSEGYEQVGPSREGVHAGRRLGNRFELIQCIKEGRGIVTWLGVDLNTGARLVIKTTPAHSLVSAARQRLEHEAQVLRSLQGPHLVPLIHFGSGGELLFLVTPFVPGRSLQERLASGTLSVVEALTLGQGVLSALAEAHAQGVLHRDIKPSNIIVDGFPNLTLTTLVDFGLARSERLDPSLRDLPVGTARYLSPEQAGLLNRPVEATSDLYAVGAVLFEALSGHPAFDGTSVGEVLRQHLTPRPRLRATGAEVPRALEEVVARLLQTDPQDRYQSAESARADLHAIERALAQGEQDPELVTGAHDTRQSLTEPSFVGRHEELVQMERELERVRTESARLLVVEAESGGGKSRLLEEFATRAPRHRALLLKGQAVAHGAKRPFQLFGDIASGITQAARERPELGERLRERLKEQAAGVCTLLPQLTPILQPEHQSLGPESLGATRGIAALTELLCALGSEAEPVLVLLDDCQWADESTLKALEGVRQRNLRESPGHALIVIAFRTEEVGPEHPLRRLRPEVHLRLTAFGPADLARMLESMAGPLPHEAMELVVRLSEGNPFMASAVMHGLVEDGALAPGARGWQVQPAAMAHVRSSRQAAAFLVRRLKLLPDESLRLLSVGALLGKSFDLEHVALLTGTPSERVVEALVEPQHRHMLWAGRAGHYTFVHDKLREALLGLLAPDERRELHRLAARSFAERDGTDSFELAYHFDAAGEHALALPHAMVAAERARTQFALETAELNYRIAERGAAQADTGIRFRISTGLGDVLMLRGRYDEAQQQFERAQRLAHNPLEQARISSKLGELEFKRGNMEESNAANEQGLALLRRWVPGHDFTYGLRAVWELLVQAGHTLLPGQLARRSLEHAEEDLLAVHFYNRLTYGYWYKRGPVPTFWAHLREVNTAEHYPPTPELAQAYSTHAPVMTQVPWFSRAIAYLEKSLAMRRQWGDTWGQGQTLHFYSLALYASGRFEESIDKAREGMRLLARTGDKWEMQNAHYHLAMSLYRLGRLREAEESSRQLHASALAIGDRYALRLSLEVWGKASIGRLDKALIDEALVDNGLDTQTHTGLLQVEALRCMREEDLEGAVARLSEAHRLVEKAKLRNEYVTPVGPWYVTALRLLAARVSALAPHRRAALLKQAWHVEKGARSAAKAFRNNLAHLLRERGLLHAMEGHPRRARRWLDESLSVAESLKMRHEAAQTRLARGQVGEELGWPEAPADLERARRELAEMEQGLGTSGQSPLDKGPDRLETLSLVDRFPRVLEAGRRIASALTREAVFDAVRQSMQELLRAEHCGVFAPDALPSEGELAAAGVGRTALRRTLETGEPAIMGQGMPGGVSESMEMLGVRSLLCAPIQMRGKTVACVCASHRQVGELFGEDEERLASFVCILAGTALENAEGFERMAALGEEQGRLYREEQEAVRRRDDFLSIAAHELKTPLTSLQLHLQGLKSQLRPGARALPPERLATRLESANQQTQRMGKLVNELLDISRIAQGNLLGDLEPVDLVKVVHGVVERSREALGRAECEPRLHLAPQVVGHWDAMRLEQVVLNLVTNALKYGAGRPIDITVEQDAQEARLVVRDQGIGIAPEDTERIFERFERAVSVRHYGGFGIGLWIVREIVQALGGTVEVQSIPGQGAAFTVHLPLRPPRTRPVSGAPTPDR